MQVFSLGVNILISVLAPSFIGWLFLLVVNLDGEEGNMHAGFLGLLAGEQAVAHQNDDDPWDDEQVAKASKRARHGLDSDRVEEHSADDGLKGHGEGGHYRVWEHFGDHDEGNKHTHAQQDRHVQKISEVGVREESKHSPL